MKRTTKYVALDVHQATTSATVRAGGGRVIARAILPTSAPALVEFVRGMRGSIHVAFEEGTQAQWLHDLLVPLVDRVVVAARLGASRHGNKGDQLDADQISELLRLGALRAVYHSSPHRETLRELARAYTNLAEDSTRVMRRLKALFRAAPEAPVVLCYEAGRDGFRLQRACTAAGISALVVDSSSIEVSRRARQAKTDRLDATALLRLLFRHAAGERGHWRVLHVPSVDEEDRRHPHRALGRLTRRAPSHDRVVALCRDGASAGGRGVKSLT